MNTKDKLSALRAQLAEKNLGGFIQPVHDEYMSEYPPACNQRVAWLSGFSGSAGTLVVLADKAALFVDGRYTLQAKNEVDGALFEHHNSGELLPDEWIAQQGSALRIGYDPMLHGQASIARMQKKITLAATDNLVDRIWAGRPAAPASTIEIHDISYSGESSASKRARVAEKLRELGADAAIIGAPDCVCWLLNVRGSDVEGSPLVLSVAIIRSDASVMWFLDPARVSDALRRHLGDDVNIIPPTELKNTLYAFANQSVLCDAQSLPVWYGDQLAQAGAKVIAASDPCVLPKAMKNPVELQGIRTAHQRDGVALSKLLCWLDSQKPGTVDELSVDAKLQECRGQSNLYRGPSFNTIAGSGPNGAIVHYRATEKSNRTLQAGELFLLDSGGQYPDGTTDVTRTVAIGAPSAEHKAHFTRVLKGHIALATARFPVGRTGSQLDALARQYLWQVGLDYDHGTGHGVGHFLNVHEGPQRISKRAGDAVALRPGMIISNEPGYYKTGEYGIRIENLVAVREYQHGWLEFETLTCAPIDRRLIDVSLLTPPEKHWLNEYHAWVLDSLAPQLDERARAWLEAACASIA